MSKKLIPLILVIAAFAGASAIWHANRKPAKPTLPANVREALGVKATLLSVRRTSTNSVAVRVKVRNCRHDRQSVQISSSFLAVGKPRWPILTQSEKSTVNPYESIQEYEYQTPSHVKSTLVACDIELERPHNPKVLNFNKVDVSRLPITKSTGDVETTLLWAKSNPHIVPGSWDVVTTIGNWQPGKGKCFGVLVKTTFRRGFYGSTGFISLKNESGKDMYCDALYGNNVSAQRMLDAYGSKVDVMLNKSSIEKAIDKVSPVAGEQINDWRADNTEKTELKHPMRPETILYIFEGDSLPQKFSFGMWVREDDESVGKAHLSFGTVPIH